MIIEYDGAYWHATKTELDATKSRDLLGAGYLVARLREYPLPRLTIEDTRYTEITVHSAAPARGAMSRVASWALKVPAQTESAESPELNS